MTQIIISPTLSAEQHHSCTVLAAEFFIFTIWVAIQAVQGGLRALITDDCSRDEQSYANAWASRFGNLAGSIANLLAYLDLLPRESKLDPSSGTFQNMSLLASVTLLVTTSISCCSRRVDREEKPSLCVGSKMSLTDVWKALFVAKSEVRTICLVQIFAWMGWFPFLFYTVT
ncbi:major facilitator superfamily domain-containing protein [Penicillium angulare]|uniref:Major facilitator superfamily domain-containing protein n=1 Tax=Penicillium angulare TaxID=116970 RepID=A0A9W9G990_9EURO|nr:major facilitator superfamily domain-containing protein [Penicillium angulare]